MKLIESLQKRIEFIKEHGITALFKKIPDTEKVITPAAIQATAPDPSGASTLLAAFTALGQQFGKGAATWFSQQIKTESNAEARAHVSKAAEEFKAGHKAEGLAYATKGILMVLPDAAYDIKTWSLLTTIAGLPIEPEKIVEALSTLKAKSMEETVAFMKQSLADAGSGKLINDILSQVSREFSETLTDLANGNGQKAGEFLANIVPGGALILASRSNSVNQQWPLLKLGGLTTILNNLQNKFGTALSNLSNATNQPLTLTPAG